MGRSIRTGIAWAILGAFPVAALVALLYRFPVPFAGYRSGPTALPGAMFAVLYYGLCGGFVVLAMLGAAAGAGANLLGRSAARRERWLTLCFVLAGDLAAVMVLAVLDRIVGAW